MLTAPPLTAHATAAWAVAFFASLLPAAEPPLPLAHWSFDSPITDRVSGNTWTVPGVAGKASQFDGITGYIVREKGPRLSGPFTVEAWVALGAYPFNWCPLAQQEAGSAGYFFGIGDSGQVTLRIAAGGRWQAVESAARLPLRQWVHLAGVHEPGQLVLYIDGKPAATTAVQGEFEPAPDAAVWIGRKMCQMEQSAPVGKDRQFLTAILFDGILDELAISAGAKTAAEIARAYAQNRPAQAPLLEPRVLPAGGTGPAPFGAVYARLRYYKGWDEAWRVGDYPDVVVRFDQAPFRFVFWRGTSYIPHWVTESGIWYNNEFTETFQKGLRGSAEPMSDKICKFSHVRIIESNAARVVVHWRYVPVDVNYAQAYIDPATGWGDWTDEVYTIYPDGVAVRKATAHTSEPRNKREWHESIVVMGPGMTPNDALEPAGLTLANESGTFHTYSWQDSTPPKYPTEPPGASIQLIHTKSKYQPFALVRPADKPRFDIYAGEIRRDVSIYPWWNHWPTAFEPSNGRYALAADRASHSSLTHITWGDYASGGNWVTKLMLHGMTDRPVAELAALARSWSNPPQMQLAGAGYEKGAYDQAERAYILTRTGGSAPLAFTLAASPESPLSNPALIVKNWGEAGAALELEGRPVAPGKAFRTARRQTLDGRDLIVWIEVASTKPVTVRLAPAGSQSR